MTPEARPDLDEQWQRLRDILSSWCTVTSTEPGRIDVRLLATDVTERDITIVVTSAEWDDMWSVAWGDVDAAAEDVKQRLLGLGSLQNSAVH